MLCLQETKARNGVFPKTEWRRSAIVIPIHGMKGYNGVAILSRVPFKAAADAAMVRTRRLPPSVVELPGGHGAAQYSMFRPAVMFRTPPPIRNSRTSCVSSTKWPNGSAARPNDGNGRMVAVGDLNVAPLESDVWSHKQMLKVVSHTPIEVERLDRIGATPAGLSTRLGISCRRSSASTRWWSYRARDWAASDRGRRLDHIWVTAPLVAALRRAEIVKEARGWNMPSDHVPVLVELG